MSAERRDMSAREAKAPEKTVRRGWRMARMAAMRKVLSPISEAMIIVKDWRVAWRAPSTWAPKKYSDIVDIVFVFLALFYAFGVLLLLCSMLWW